MVILAKMGLDIVQQWYSSFLRRGIGVTHDEELLILTGSLIFLEQSARLE
jgi:hypothetical protein